MLRSKDSSNDESASSPSSNKLRGNLTMKTKNMKIQQVPINATIITFDSNTDGISSQSFDVTSGQLISVSKESSIIDKGQFRHHHHLRINDDSVSSNHATILFNEGVVVIKDNLSEFGTHVNGNKLLCENKEYSDWLVLANDDNILFGNILFTVRINNEKTWPSDIFVKFKVKNTNNDDDFPVRELILTNAFDIKSIVHTPIGRKDNISSKKPCSKNMYFTFESIAMTHGYIYAYKNEVKFSHIVDPNIFTFHNDARLNGRQIVTLTEKDRLDFGEPSTHTNRLYLTVDCIRNVSDVCDQENKQPPNESKKGKQNQSSKLYSSFSIEQRSEYSVAVVSATRTISNFSHGKQRAMSFQALNANAYRFDNRDRRRDHSVDFGHLSSRRMSIDSQTPSETMALSVLGNAIAPEQKPRVPTMSERDLTRKHTSCFTRNRSFFS